MKLSIEDLARFPRPGMAVPGKIAFAPDGRAVTFLQSSRGDLTRELWSLDLETGERSVILGAADVGGGATDANVSREEALRRERERLRETGITHYEWAEAAPVLLAPVRGDLHVRRDGKVHCIARGASEAHLSRDGKLAAFVRKNELFVVSTDGAATDGSGERQLTFDAQPGVTNGVAEYMAQEEMGRSRGFWFSQDGRFLAFEQADERHIPIFRIAHLSKGPHEVEEHRYPFAGAENARVRLGVVPTAGGPIQWMDLAGAEYLARVNWRADGQLLVQVQPRDQRRLELRAHDVTTGKGRTLLVEESSSWVNLHNDLRVLDTGEMLWASERTGWKHLYLYREEKLLRALTSGEWAVDSVLGCDGTHVFFTATKEGPLERHIYKVALAGGEPVRLTEARGMHEGVLARDGSSFVDFHESRAKPPSVSVRGRKLHEPAPLEYPAPELLTFLSRDGTTLHGALYMPAEGSPILKRPAPLVVAVYGGPHVQMVQDSWALSVDLRAQYLASRGFAVLKVDNRGSARRGLAFESAIYKKMGTVEVADQVDGVRHLVGRGIADPGRVGVYGWSYGGYMTLLCLAKAPEVFRCGVSGAPVTEWEGYDTHYTERYMSTPLENRDGYREGSVLTHAASIRGKLLLVHGMIDENVHFRHSARLIDVLVKAGVRHDLLLFPDERHMPRGEKDRVSLEARIVDYFERNLV